MKQPLPFRAGRRAGLMFLLAAVSNAHAQLGALARGRPPAAEADTGDGAEPARPDAALPAGARLERDLAYGADPQHRIDVYHPARAERAPIVVMVHGGAWMLGDKGGRGVAGTKAARWLPRGTIVVSVNYRMDRGHPDALAQADDVARALAFVQQRAASWGGDPAKVVLMGHSSGAHLVALLAADPGIATRQGAQPWLGTVALDSAALDVTLIMEQHHPGFYDRVFGADRKRWEDNSPYWRLHGTPRPMLLVCSDRRADSCNQARRFASKVQSAGGRAEVLPVDLGHGQVNAELGRGGEYTDRVEAFMRSLGV